VQNSFGPRYDFGVDSASSRNEYQEHFLGVKAAGKFSKLMRLNADNSFMLRIFLNCVYVLYYSTC
jgi:hypothetical protein